MRMIGIVTAVITVAVVALAGVALLLTAHTQNQDPTGTGTELVMLKVPDMFCAGCEMGVKLAARRVEGVKDVKTDADTRTTEVTFDPLKTDAEAIAAAITKGTGFRTDMLRTGKKT